MKYEEIYSRSYMKRCDPGFYEDKEFAYDTMKEWLHEIVAFPWVRKIFSSIILDDVLEELTFELVNSVDEQSDNDFVIKLFTDGFVICWMRPKVETAINLATVIGGKDEKKLISNYQANIDRLNSLELKLKKYIRDYGYINGTYETE